MKKTNQQSLWEMEVKLKVYPEDAVAVCYGAGVNSTSMLIELYRRGLQPTWITFSDTGGEKPETYAYLPVMNEWLASIGWPEIKVLNYASGSKYKSLEDECLKKSIMPGLAFGRATCSIKWKQGPFLKFMNRDERAKEVWASDQKRIVRAIGFECAEGRRVRRSTYVADRGGEKYCNWFPLNESQIDRDDCIEIIKQAGLPIPPKSACWYCHASRPEEIRWLKTNHPELFQRALVMEAKALPRCTSVKGLGRRFSWAEISKEW